MSQFGNGWSNPPGSTSGGAGCQTSKTTAINPAVTKSGFSVARVDAVPCPTKWMVDCGVNPTGGPFAMGATVWGVDNTTILSQWLGQKGPTLDHIPTDDEVEGICLHNNAPAPPPTAPPTNPPTGQIKWWNVGYCTATTRSPVLITVQGASGEDAISNVIHGGSAKDYNGVDNPYWYGPYDTQEDAQAGRVEDLKDLGTACDKMRESGNKCDVKPLFTCPDIPPGVTAFAVAGTEKWAEDIQKLVDGLGQIGNLVFSFIDGLLDVNSLIAKISASIEEKWPWDWVKGLLSLLRQVLCWVGPYISTLREVIKCARAVAKAMFPKCSPDAVFGLITFRALLHTLEHIELGTDAAAWVIAKSGMSIDPLLTVVDYLISYACPVNPPSEADAAEAYKYNIISEKLAASIMQAHGYNWQTVLPGIVARGDKPGWREALQFTRRMKGTAADEDYNLRGLGVIDDSYRNVLRTVYNELPTISDHLEWLRKNVFDTDYISHFHMLDGFGSKQDLAAAGFPAYIDASGKPADQTFWGQFGDDLHALGMQIQYAARHYAAHWINPSFGQQFSMVQRLRPGRVSPDLVFSRADLLRTMQEMDVGPFFRERLEAVSHPLPNLTLCLKMFRYGVIERKEFIEKLLDLGYSEYDAGIIAQSQTFETRRLNASASAGWTPAAMAKAYAVGQLTAEQVTNEIAYLGFTKDDADRLMRRAEIEFKTEPIRRLQRRIISSALSTQDSAYKCGAIDADALKSVYRNAGIPDNLGAINIQNVDASMEVALCNAQIKAFKGAVTSGKITLETAGLLLAQVRVPDVRAQQYLQSWALEVKVRAPQASASRILRWVGQGLLDRDVAADRLRNLGWTDPDLTLSLAESLARLTALQNRMQAQAARSQQAAARAALRSAQTAETIARQLRSQLRGIASRNTLQKWYRDYLIDDTYFIEAMHARGYDDDSTLKYLEEAALARLKALKKPKSKPTKGAQGNATP